MNMLLSLISSGGSNIFVVGTVVFGLVSGITILLWKYTNEKHKNDHLKEEKGVLEAVIEEKAKHDIELREDLNEIKTDPIAWAKSRS